MACVSYVFIKLLLLNVILILKFHRKQDYIKLIIEKFKVDVEKFSPKITKRIFLRKLQQAKHIFMRRWILGTPHHKLAWTPFVLSSVRHTQTKAREVRSPMWANAKRLIITGSVLVGTLALFFFKKNEFPYVNAVFFVKKALDL